MSIFKTLADKARAKKEEMEREAAKKAAELAFEQSKKAAKSALERAGKSVENALLGDDEDAPASDAPPPSSKKPPSRRPKPAPKPAAKPTPRAAPKEDERALAAKRRAEDEAKLDKQVDDDLAALKRKLKK